MFRRLKNIVYPLTLSRGMAIVRKVKKGQRTPEWYAAGIDSLLEYLEVDMPLKDITAEDIAGWWKWINTRSHRRVAGQKLSPYTTNSYGRAVRAYFNLLVDIGHLKESPFQVVLPKPPKKSKKSISEEDIQRMIAAARTIRDQAFVLTLYHSGCRLNAVVNMTVSGLRLYEVEGKWEGHALTWDEKIDQYIYASFQDRAARALNAYVLSRPFTDIDQLWLNSHGRPLTRSGGAQILRRIGKRAGIKRFNAHAFRHAKVQRMIKNGAPHKAIQDALHWQSDAMIQEYVQSSPADIHQYNLQFDKLD